MRKALVVGGAGFIGSHLCGALLAGPKINPANSAPTTWGILNFFVSRPNNLVLIKMRARSNKKL